MHETQGHAEAIETDAAFGTPRARPPCLRKQRQNIMNAVSTEDRAINPDLERFMAKRMGAKTIEVKGSHLSLISQPDEITRLILEAAGQSD
jgi:hypothetical protein